MDYDVIVVGARCAGSSTAMLLARKGFRVLVVDRSSFPSDIMSTLIIKYPGVKLLKEWGVLGNVLATGCPPIRKWIDDKGDFPLSAALPMVDDVVTIAPRRFYLDKILADAAVAAGVELVQNFIVDEVLVEDGCVKGIRGHVKTGKSHTFTAPMVVGADGKHSLVARTVQPPVYHDYPVQAFYYYGFWSGIPDQGLVSYWQPRRFVLAIPTNDNLTCIVVGRPISEFETFRQDFNGNYQHSLEIAPLLAEHARQGRLEGRLVGTADLPNAYRKPFGPGWALAGDAGHHEDPLLGHGIMNAFHDAELLSQALEAGMSGREDLQTALALYEEQRNAWSLPAYERNVIGARLEGWDPPRELKLRAALRQNPVEASRYFGTRVYAIPYDEFFAPENIARILEQAVVSA